ncbi:hypothetical protein MAPG_04637, partial [Magnaporthiopsis poae ATCC 64411]
MRTRTPGARRSKLNPSPSSRGTDDLHLDPAGDKSPPLALNKQNLDQPSTPRQLRRWRVAPGTAEEVLREVHQDLERLRDEGWTEEEIGVHYEFDELRKRGWTEELIAKYFGVGSGSDNQNQDATPPGDSGPRQVDAGTSEPAVATPVMPTAPTEGPQDSPRGEDGHAPRESQGRTWGSLLSAADMLTSLKARWQGSDRERRPEDSREGDGAASGRDTGPP